MEILLMLPLLCNALATSVSGEATLRFNPTGMTTLREVGADPVLLASARCTADAVTSINLHKAASMATSVFVYCLKGFRNVCSSTTLVNNWSLCGGILTLAEAERRWEERLTGQELATIQTAKVFANKCLTFQDLKECRLVVRIAAPRTTYIRPRNQSVNDKAITTKQFPLLKGRSQSQTMTTDRIVNLWRET